MKILALVTDAFGGTGGIAQYNRDLLTALAQMDSVSELRVLPRVGKANFLPDKVKQFEPIAAKSVYGLEAVRATRSWSPDFVFCGHISLLPLAWLIKRLWRIPCWLQVHGIDAWEPLQKQPRVFLEGIDLVTSVSRYTRRRFISWAMIRPEKVRVLPNTFGEAYMPLNRLVARQNIGLTHEPALLTVGRLSKAERYKGHDLVIGCLPNLLKIYPDLIYFIAGTGDDQERLERLANHLGVEASVRFLGRVSNAQLPNLYNAADLFVMPSTGEGFGIVFLEALACGIPVLGLGGDGSRDPLRDGEFGAVASESKLCDAIQSCISEPRPLNLADQVVAIFGQTSFVLR